MVVNEKAKSGEYLLSVIENVEIVQNHIFFFLNMF